MNRKIQPKIQPVENIRMPESDMYLLSNGIPLYSLNYSEEEVVRIDCMFRAGIYYQSHPLVASFTNQMMKEGTRNRTAAEIAEQLDFYGSWLHLSCTHHDAYLTLYSLNKHLRQTIRLIEDMILNSVFPEKEFQIYRHRRKQQYLIDLEKVQYLSHKRFMAALYGPEHPYGRSADSADFDALKREWIEDFYRGFYALENSKIIVSGKVTPSILECVRGVFEKTASDLSGQTIQKPEFAITPSTEHHLFIEKNNSLQAAVQIGRTLFNRKHPDFQKFKILNTVLGGYFGSRLMTNIREEKGYTYGITSGVTTFPDTGHLLISTQTGVEYVEPLIREVSREMERLCTELIPGEELNTAKNYMLGELVRKIDGGFTPTDTFISLLANELDYSFYEKEADVIRSTTAEELQELAIQYFNPDRFYEVVAGGIKKKRNE